MKLPKSLTKRPICSVKLLGEKTQIINRERNYTVISPTFAFNSFPPKKMDRTMLEAYVKGGLSFSERRKREIKISFNNQIAARLLLSRS